MAKCLDCTKEASYNYKNEKKRLYCHDHKKEGMISLKSIPCLKCNKSPVFNFKGSKRLYCFDHKEIGMVNVKDKPCIFEDCELLPSYNYESEKKPIYCEKHKKDDMVNIYSKKCEKCTKQAMYNIEGGKPKYCSNHMTDNMTNVLHKKCKTPLCGILLHSTKNDYCSRCSKLMYPDLTHNNNYKTKESAIVDFIKNVYQNYSWKFDKIIDGGCSKKRPDIFLDMGDYILIIEIDEDQHKNYDCSCENKRIMQIFNDLGCRNMTIIRFNPDAYINHKNEKIESCWTNNNGKLILKKENEWYQRLFVLSNTLDLILNNKSSKEVDIIHLYYNGFIEDNILNDIKIKYKITNDSVEKNTINNKITETIQLIKEINKDYIYIENYDACIITKNKIKIICDKKYVNDITKYSLDGTRITFKDKNNKKIRIQINQYVWQYLEGRTIPNGYCIKSFNFNIEDVRIDNLYLFNGEFKEEKAPVNIKLPLKYQLLLGMNYLPKYLSLSTKKQDQIVISNKLKPFYSVTKICNINKSSFDNIIIPGLKEYYTSKNLNFEEEHNKYITLLDSYHNMINYQSIEE